MKFIGVYDYQNVIMFFAPSIGQRWIKAKLTVKILNLPFQCQNFKQIDAVAKEKTFPINV